MVALLAAAFGKPATPETFEVYEVALEDLEIEDPRAVVKRLLRTMERWPSPAQLRRAILDQFGLLAPDVDQAWTAVVEYVSGSRTVLHDLAREALRAIGGSWAVKTGNQGVVFAQFRDAYRAIAARSDGEALERSWNGLALAPVSQLRLGDGTDRGLGPG